MPGHVRIQRWRDSLLVAFGLLGVTRAASAQAHPAAGSINAIVTDTGLVPIADADISIQRTAVRISTGDDGRFYITTIPTGQYQLTVQRLGFRTISAVVDITPDDTTRLSIVMERTAPLLDAVVTTGVGRSLRM